MSAERVQDLLDTAEAAMAGVRPEEWASQPAVLLAAAERALIVAHELTETARQIHRLVVTS